MSISLNIKDTINLYLNCLEYNIYRVLIFLGLVSLYFILNKKDNKLLKYILTIFNIALILIIIYCMKSLFAMDFENPLININLYFVSSIIYLLFF